MHRSKVLLLVILVSVITSCAVYQKIEPGQSVAVGRLQVTPDIAWSGLNSYYFKINGPSATWTRDGTPINLLFIFDGIENGAPLFELERRDDMRFPIFVSGMSEADVDELVADSIKQFWQASTIETVRAAPATFADQRGFVFQYRLTAKSELDLRSYAAGAIVRDKLYLIMFTAPRLHYYDKDIDSVKTMIESARFTSS